MPLLNLEKHVQINMKDQEFTKLIYELRPDITLDELFNAFWNATGKPLKLEFIPKDSGTDTQTSFSEKTVTPPFNDYSLAA